MAKVTYYNADKLSRAKATAGANATELAILKAYLKLAGLAKDENGKVIPYENYEYLKEEVEESKLAPIKPKRGRKKIEEDEDED